MKRYVLFFLFVVLMFTFSGCNTGRGAADGFAKDVHNTWTEAEKVDNWLQKHAW